MPGKKVIFAEPPRPSRARSLAQGWSKLPAELRLKIYRATWEPRAVVMDSKAPGTKGWGPFKRRREWDDTSFKVSVTSVPPVSLHINREARDETLRHYIPFFRGEATRGGRTQVLYFNPSQDVLFLTLWPDLAAVGAPSVNRDVARFFNMLSVAREVCVCGPYDGFALLRSQVGALAREDPQRWFPLGQPVLDYWGLDAAEAAVADTNMTQNDGCWVAPSGELVDGLPRHLLEVVLGRLWLFSRSGHHNRSDYLTLPALKLFLGAEFGEETARKLFRKGGF